MFDCSVPDCNFSVGPENLDVLESVDGRGWWNAWSFCPEHAEPIREGYLPREEICTSYIRKHNQDLRTDFVQMDGTGTAVGFPPSVIDSNQLGHIPIDEYHSEFLLEGTCPYSDCEFRGTLMKYSGYNCPHMCTVCGGIVHC